MFDHATIRLALTGRFISSTQSPVGFRFFGKDNALDSAYDAYLFAGEAELSLVA
jgi:hypothetical protein